MRERPPRTEPCDCKPAQLLDPLCSQTQVDALDRDVCLATERGLVDNYVNVAAHRRRRDRCTSSTGPHCRHVFTYACPCPCPCPYAIPVRDPPARSDRVNAEAARPASETSSFVQGCDEAPPEQ